MNNQLPQLILGDVIVPVPVIQGGMGVGVSRSRLAGAVAKEGGIGVISTAQIGYDEENFEKNPAECNCRAIIKHIGVMDMIFINMGAYHIFIFSFQYFVCKLLP